MKSLLVRLSQYAVIAGISLFVIAAVGIIMGENPAHALPEFVDRTGEPLDISLKSLLKINVKTYKPGACPMCKDGIEVKKPGSR